MRKNKRKEIIAATISLVAKHGVSGSSVRLIAEEAGVTEGALYRHFASKEDLCHQAYCQIVAEMAVEKENILESKLSFAAKTREWVRVSYGYFDRFPDAFTFVILTVHDFPDSLSEITTRQGRLLKAMIISAVAEDELPPLIPELAVSHFTGVMLNVPRLINEGLLDKPASQYTEDVVAAIYRVFDIREDTQAVPETPAKEQAAGG